jgi:hypothetical protein
VAARANGATLTRYSAASPTASPCATQRSTRPGGATPRPSAAAIGFGKLDDGS